MKNILNLILAITLIVSCALAEENSWAPNQVLQPEQLLEILKSDSKDKPLIIHVGFKFLFNHNHIAGSKYLGPANDEKGLALLRTELKKTPRTREILVYCGCCPLIKCPNVHPAFKTLQSMGFKNVKILNLSDNLKKNWIDKGYPVEKN
jgi:thiosulfate/3-mercaptopyruvate sulfurtransferase